MSPSEALERAIAANTEALRVHAIIGNPADWASAANNQAKMYRERIAGQRADNLEEAICYHHAALGVFAAGAFGPEAANDCKTLDNPHWNDDLVKAAPRTVTSRQRGQEQYTVAEFEKDWADTLISLGNTYCERINGDRGTNIEDAIGCYDKCLVIYKQRGDLRSQGMVANNLGKVYTGRLVGRRLDNHRIAIRHFRLAVTLHRQAGRAFEIAKTEHNLGATLNEFAFTFNTRPTDERSREIEEAIELLRASLETRTRDDHPAQWAMSSMMLAYGFATRIVGDHGANLGRAIKIYEEVLQKGNLETVYPLGLPKLLTNLGAAYLERQTGNRTDNLENALQHCRAAVDASAKVLLLQESFGARLGVAKALVALGRQEEAYDFLRSSLEQFEDTRTTASLAGERRRWMELANSLYDLMIQVCWQRDTVEALAWSERGRGRALAEALVSRDRRPEGVDEDAYRFYLALRSEADILEREFGQFDHADEHGRRYQELTKLRAQILEMESQFAVSDTTWSRHSSPLSVEEIVETAVIAQTHLLILRVTETGCYVWLVSPQHKIRTKHFEVPSNLTIKEFLLGSVQSDTSGWLTEYAHFKEARLNVGWKEAIQPWLRHMDEALGDIWTRWLSEVHGFVNTLMPAARGDQLPPNLILIPSQRLGLIPLHAAWRNHEGLRRYWCDDYVLSFAPSVDALRHALGREESRARGYLGVADPTSGFGSDSLPWSTVEVQQVARHFPPQEVTLFGGERNPEDWTLADVHSVLTALAQPHRVVHMACHGVHNVTSPWNDSGLMLHGTTNGPNLPLQLLASLDLSGCELGIVSACETAMSDPSDKTEEYVGVPAALLTSGAATVFGSLWVINDLAATLTVTKSLDAISESDLSLGAANRLHAAQKWLREAPASELMSVIQSLDCGAELRKRAELVFEDLGNTPYSHPFWWAPLVCVGKP